MIGARPELLSEGRATAAPRRRRLGGLLAVGEVIVLVLLVLHPGAAVGTNGDDLRARSLGPTGHVSHDSPSVLETPTTTLPVDPPTTLPPTPVTPTVPPAAVPNPTASGPTPAAGSLASNIAPQPNFLQSCSGSRYDDSLSCVAATLQAITNGRSHEGLPPMVLPTNWGQLSAGQQIFVATNLERTVRGLPPLAAMATSLDQGALEGARQDVDPGPPAGFPNSQWGSNWAGAVGNPLEAIYFWMYDDGTASANIDCTATNQSGCWGHRENILMRLPCTVCLMGTGWVDTGYRGDPSMTEVLVESSGSPALDFTWQQESAYLS